MKYLFYLLYREDSNQERLRPTSEMLCVTGIFYDDDLELVTITGQDLADILIPMSYNNYLSLLDAFKKSNQVEITGNCAFSELTKNDFDYEMTDKALEDYNKQYFERVKSFNLMSEKSIVAII